MAYYLSVLLRLYVTVPGWRGRMCENQPYYASVPTPTLRAPTLRAYASCLSFGLMHHAYAYMPHIFHASCYGFMLSCLRFVPTLRAMLSCRRFFRCSLVPPPLRPYCSGVSTSTDPLKEVHPVLQFLRKESP